VIPNSFSLAFTHEEPLRSLTLVFGKQWNSSRVPWVCGAIQTTRDVKGLERRKRPAVLIAVASENCVITIYAPRVSYDCESWRSNWASVIPFFAHPPEIRKGIYTTTAIESLHMSLRKVTKARGSFPEDAVVFKPLYLGLRNIAKKWTCRCTTGRPRSTDLPSSTKTGCRLNSPRDDETTRQNPGYGNRGKQPRFSTVPTASTGNNKFR
jgi:hypothetical protein